MDHLGLLEGEVDAMTAAVAAADPDALIPACPGWTVRDLVTHLVAVHVWARAALKTATPPPYDERVLGPDLAEEYAGASQALVAQLRELPGEHPCWTFDKTNRTASFWQRRQLHEVAVHRWDVSPYPLTDEIALDGIDEVIRFFAPRQVSLGRTTLPTGSLHLEAAGRDWQVGVGDPTETLTGEPTDVLVRLWRRGAPLPGAWAQVQLAP